MRSDKPLSLCTSFFMTGYFIWEPKKDDNMSDLQNKITRESFFKGPRVDFSILPRRPFGFWHRCFTSDNFVWQSRDNLAKFENMNVIHKHRRTTHVKQSCSSKACLFWEFIYWVPLAMSKRMQKELFVVNKCSISIILMQKIWVHVVTELVISDTLCIFHLIYHNSCAKIGLCVGLRLHTNGKDLSRLSLTLC